MIMNREVKFRGKSTTNKEWKYGIPIALDDSTITVEDEGVFNDGSASPFFSKWDFVISETIGQFTGFHDQNWKEIYEGDILRFYDNNKEYVCVVGWNNEVGAWCIRFKGEEYFGIRPLGEWIFEYKIEVIGNIYDNKELLEE